MSISKNWPLLLLILSCEAATPSQPTSTKVSPLPAQSTPTSTSLPTDSLTAASARETLDALTPKIRGCFPGEPRWIVSVSLRVEPGGTTSEAKVFDLLQGSASAKCVEEQLLTARFSPFSGGAVRLSYAFPLGPLLMPADLAVPVPMSAPSPRSQPAPQSIPSDASAALLEAERLFALGDLDGAEKALLPFQEKPLPEMLYLLGGIAQRRGEVLEMCGYYRQYLAASPKSPAAPGLQKQVEAVCASSKK